MTIKLHYIENALMIKGGGVTRERRRALTDKTETLHLIRRDHYWHVSSQRTGLRMFHSRLQSQARAYMGYMLKHVGDELRALASFDVQAAMDQARPGRPIREAHDKAIEQIKGK